MAPVDVDTPSGETVLVAGDADELLEALEESLRAGAVSFARYRTAADQRSGESCADVAIVAVRRKPGRSSLGAAIAVARDIESSLTADAVVVGVSIAQGTSSGMGKVSPKVLRPLGREVLHQVQAARHRSSGGSWRSARLRTGLAALQTAGIRVFRIARAVHAPAS
jgi:hypothetical protein